MCVESNPGSLSFTLLHSLIGPESYSSYVLVSSLIAPGVVNEPQATSSVVHVKLRKGGEIKLCYSHLQLNKGLCCNTIYY